MRKSKLLLSLSILTTSSLAVGAIHKVRLDLPAEAVVKVERGDRVLIAPFVLATSESDEKAQSRIDVQVELTDYLAKALRKKKFDAVIDRDVEVPTYNLNLLKEDSVFWSKVARGHGAAYVVSGSVDFRAEDRSTYETQEFTSPYDRRTYYRQVLVERTGFILEILLFVFNREGSLVKELPLKTFMNVEVRNYDHLQGFFETIYPMEEQILHLFVAHKSKQRRMIYGF